MKKILAVLLAVVLSVSGFAACSDSKSGNEEEKINETKKTNAELIVGKWKSVIDLTSMMEEAFASEEEMAEYIEVTKFEMIMLFEFKDDNTMTLAVDEEALDKSFDEFFESIKSGFSAYFEAVIEENGIEMTVDELLELSGTSMDQLVEAMSAVAKEQIDASTLSYEYAYEVKDDKLYSYEKDEEMDEDDYTTISFPDEDTLDFVDVEGIDEEEREILEMVDKLTRIK